MEAGERAREITYPEELYRTEHNGYVEVAVAKCVCDLTVKMSK